LEEKRKERTRVKVLDFYGRDFGWG
jgi:hypothetical protein